MNIKTKYTYFKSYSLPQINCVIFGNEDEQFHGHPVVLIKSCGLYKHFSYASLYMNHRSSQRINPDISEAHRLRAWFDNGGGENITRNISMRTYTNSTFINKWKSFKQDNASSSTSSTSSKPDNDCDKPHFDRLKTLLATVSCNAYRGCPQECNERIVSIGNDQFRCEKCNAERSLLEYPQMVDVRRKCLFLLWFSRFLNCKILIFFR